MPVDTNWNLFDKTQRASNSTSWKPLDEFTHVDRANLACSACLCAAIVQEHREPSRSREPIEPFAWGWGTGANGQADAMSSDREREREREREWVSVLRERVGERKETCFILFYYKYGFFNLALETPQFSATIACVITWKVSAFSHDELYGDV